MAGKVEVRIEWNRIPAFLNDLKPAVRKASRQSAQAVKDGAAKRSRVRTGAMRDGWRVAEDGEGIAVTNPVPYTVFNEYGTINMSSQPMLTPPVEEERGHFPGRVAEAVNALAKEHGR